MSIYNYTRRHTVPVRIGRTAVGGDNPVRLQSMTNTSTNDIEGSAAQVTRIAGAGADIVRLTTQGVREAESLGKVRELLERRGLDIPLVADVHFTPAAAMKAATTAHKVRINPGNFADAARTFRILTYTDEQYALELERIAAQLRPLLELCRAHDTALRLGVNAGSLSDRIMSRYGDTPEGMVASAMEYLRICHAEDFHRVVVSIKASNPVVMVRTVRLMAAAMDAEGLCCPLHLGVTEAGNGSDGRIKSAVGIGTLLAEGLGDTIRVSLSEAPEREIPVAALLRDYIAARAGHPRVVEAVPRSRSHSGLTVVEVDMMPRPEWIAMRADGDPEAVNDGDTIILTSAHPNPVGEIASFIDRVTANACITVKLHYDDADRDVVSVKAAADFGALILNDYPDAVWLDAPALTPQERSDIMLGILQATRRRITHTDYIACPGCGRTLFDLENTLAQVRQATSHLTGLKIGVMGCIVNGPGEMADADYGYVGAGPGRVSLYKNRTLMVKNIPTDKALGALIELIKQGGDWKDPD